MIPKGRGTRKKDDGHHTQAKMYTKQGGNDFFYVLTEILTRWYLIISDDEGGVVFSFLCVPRHWARIGSILAMTCM